MKQQDYTYVLSFCNDVRQRLGRKPVHTLRRGHTGDPARCPIANTINWLARSRRVEADAGAVTLGEEGRPPYALKTEHVAAVPLGVSYFITDFDLGNLPEFEGTGWAE